MMKRYTYGEIIWIDLQSPTQSEVRSLIEEFAVDPITAEELLLPTLRDRVDLFPKYMYLIMHFPALRHTHKTKEQEIDFIIGRDFIITTRYDTIDPLHQFSKVFEMNSILDKSEIGEHAGFVFFYMLKKLYKSVEHELEYIQDNLSEIEQAIFGGKEKETVATLSIAGRDLLSLRQSIEPHRDLLRTIETEGAKFLGTHFTPYIRALLNEYYRVHNRISRNTESLRELRETNNSLLSTKQNETMKLFTIMAFLMLPLTLISQMFGMNTSYIPFAGNPLDFWIVVGLMAAATLAMFAFFKHKKWL